MLSDRADPAPLDCAGTVSKARRESAADWLMVLGAVVLLASLFATWSHQFSAAFLARWGGTGLLADVPRDPTAWQVYSIAAVLLALVAAGLVAIALAGTPRARVVMLLVIAVAVAFTLHALGHPPTNGVTVFDPRLSSYVPSSPRAGFGETLALAGLGCGLAGVLFSFATD
jgi:hypothetical protein